MDVSASKISGSVPVVGVPGGQKESPERVFPAERGDVIVRSNSLSSFRRGLRCENPLVASKAFAESPSEVWGNRELADVLECLDKLGVGNVMVTSFDRQLVKELSSRFARVYEKRSEACDFG